MFLIRCNFGIFNKAFRQVKIQLTRLEASGDMRIDKYHLYFCLIALCLSEMSTGAEYLHLHTENFPPYSMVETRPDGQVEIIGISTDIIKELMDRSDQRYTLELVPWKRAYDTARLKRNHGVFSTTKTRERLDLFRWVGPVVNDNWVLMAKKGTPIELTTLREAGAYRIGGYHQDAIADYLVAQGLSVEYVANDILNVRKLAKNRIDLWPVVQLKGYSMAKGEGVEIEDVFTLKKTEMALAMNKETDPELVDTLNQVLDAMHQDGTVAKIISSYIEK